MVIRGGVYITSTEYYEEEILRNLCASDSLYRNLDKDFGVWESDISILATLQGTSLSFKELKPKQLGDINVKGLKAIFKEQLPTGVFKWDLMSNSEELAHKIFTEDVTYVGPVTHLVFIHHSDRKIIDEIANSIVQLDQIQGEAIEKGVSIKFSQEDPWWGINIQSLENVSPFLDGKYPGQLKCDNEFLYVLLIQLPSIDALRAWYSYENHSDIRETVYSELVSKVEQIYQQIKDNEDGLIAKHFEEIEQEVWNSGRLRRMDYIFNKKSLIFSHLNFNVVKALTKSTSRQIYSILRLATPSLITLESTGSE